jgi:hypothetical protein
VLDVIDVGKHEPAVEQLECFHQVLRNSRTAQLGCPESFIALAEQVSMRRVPDTDQSTSNAVQPMRTPSSP